MKTQTPWGARPENSTRGGVRGRLAGVVRSGCLRHSILFLLGGAISALATTVVPPTFDELVGEAEIVFEGRVTAMESRWVGENETRRIKTYYTFRVDELLKGEAASPYVLEVLGGTVGDTTLKVEGAPVFAIGDRAILFVAANGTQFVPLVGIMHGHYKVEKDAATGREMLLRHDGSALQDTAEIGKPVPPPGMSRLQAREAPVAGLTREEFKERIRKKVRDGKP